jgi:hypothetical protein
MIAAASTEELQEKYLDWCSARITDCLLDLSPNEIGALAGARPLPSAVAGLVDRIAAAVELPPFAAWVTAYAADPAPFDQEILGFGERASAAVAAV